jgi:hypothetical protein
MWITWSTVLLFILAYSVLLSVLDKVLTDRKIQRAYGARWASIQARLESEDTEIRRAAAREALRLNREGPYKH